MLETKELHEQKVLLASVRQYCKCTRGKIWFSHEDFDRDTNTLYRYGYFYFNHERHSISAWSKHKKVVTFENEADNVKFKYSYERHKIVYGKLPRFKLLHILRSKVSIWLKDLSDKLQP